MIKLNLFFYLVLFHCESYANDGNRIKESFDYLWKHTIHNAKEPTFDIKESEFQIAVLTEFLKNNNVSPDIESAIKITRGLSLKEINFSRLHNKDIVDIAQSEQSVKDLEFAIANNIGNTASNHFQAGHVYLHLLKYPKKAYENWEICAELSHAGCMNIMASHRFTGTNGLPVDIKESIKWHEKTASTGIRYVCAGIYSASIIAKFLYYFPELSENKNWHQWIETRNKLLSELEKNKKDKNRCRLGATLALETTWFKNSGMESLYTFEEALDKIEDKFLVNALRFINNESNMETTLKNLEQIEDKNQQCSASLYIYLHSKSKANEYETKQIEGYLTNLDTERCDSELSFIDHLQSAGR